MDYRGSAIARIVGETAAQYSNDFNPAVNMWVHEEIWDGMKLSHVINEQHENPKYLPGKKLPENVVCDHVVCSFTIRSQ